MLLSASLLFIVGVGDYKTENASAGWDSHGERSQEVADAETEVVT